MLAVLMRGAVSGFALAMALAAVPSVAQQADGQPDDILVTALKREQRLQDVSASITAFTSEDLSRAGITSTQDLEGSVPGLQFGNAGIDGARISIRGVSSVRAYTGDDSATAVHVNGVFMPYSGLALATLFDVERVEVLKGPQGTLYGRNATAGAMNIITARAKPDFGASGEVSYGSYNTLRANGMVNVPLAEDHAIRLAVTYAKGDGFIANGLDDDRFADENFFGGRLTYSGELGGARIDLVGEIVRDRGQNNFGGVVPVARNPNLAGILAKPGFYGTLNDAEQRREATDTTFLSGTIEVPLSSSMSLRMITGYTGYDIDIANDAQLLFNPAELGIPASPQFGQAFATQNGYSFSQEVNLIGSIGDRFDFVAGAFYVYQDVTETRRQDQRGAPIPPATGIVDDFRLSQWGEAIGLFVDGTFSITDRLRVLGGIRYNSETKLQRQTQGYFEPFFGIPNPLYFSAELKATYSDPTYRAGFEFDVADNNLLYGTYSKGFRSGAIGGLVGLDNFYDVAFGGPGQLGLVRLEPETAYAFELGSKNQFFDRRLTVNLAAFHTVLKDQLFFQFDELTFQLVEGNIGRSRLYGVDAEVIGRVTDAFEISVLGQWLESEITSVGSSGAFVSEGNNLPYAPQFSFTVAGDYTIPVGADAQILLRAEYAYKGKHFFNLANTVGEDEIGLVNASVRFEKGSFYGFVTGRNLTGEQYFVNGGTPPAAGPRSLQVARLGAPREVFVGAGFRF